MVPRWDARDTTRCSASLEDHALCEQAPTDSALPPLPYGSESGVSVAHSQSAAIVIDDPPRPGRTDASPRTQDTGPTADSHPDCKIRGIMAGGTYANSRSPRHENHHVRFNMIVQQCAIVEDDGGDDYNQFPDGTMPPKDWLSNTDFASDDGLFMKELPRRAPEISHKREHQLIARVPWTTLKCHGK